VLAAFEACISGGGVAVFPADTVYGLACDPDDAAAVERLYALKGRAPDKPAAVMFFDLEPLRAATPWLGSRTRAAFDALLPGGVTLLVPNPEHRFPLACGPDPDTLGLRVPAATPLRGARVAVLQSSANHAGGQDPRRPEDVPQDIRERADLVLDAGELPGVASTVVDLRRYEDGEWSVLREGAVPRTELAAALARPHQRWSSQST
jgi:L-threonylcarbamoyladenylate synthase